MKFVYSNETVLNSSTQVKALQIFTPNPCKMLYISQQTAVHFLQIKVKQCLKYCEIQETKAELRLVVIISECYCCLTHGVKTVLVYETVFWQTVRIV